jgi:hypothetical protein
MVLVSLVVGGESNANRPLVRAITSLRSAAKPLNAAVVPCDGSVDLDIVFKVSGPIVAGDFEGVEVLSFRRATRRLTIEVGVPEDGAGDDPEAFLERTLTTALAVAEGRLRTLPDLNVEDATAIVEQLIHGLAGRRVAPGHPTGDQGWQATES